MLVSITRARSHLTISDLLTSLHIICIIFLDRCVLNRDVNSTPSVAAKQCRRRFSFYDAFAVLVLIPDSCTLIPSPRLDKISAIARKTFAASSSFFMFPSPFSVNSHIVPHIEPLALFAIVVFLSPCIRLPEVLFLFRLTAHRTHALHVVSSPNIRLAMYSSSASL